MPGHDIGVVLHNRENDFVALADLGHAPKRIRNEIDRFGGITRKNDLVRAGRIEETPHRLA